MREILFTVKNSPENFIKCDTFHRTFRSASLLYLRFLTVLLILQVENFDIKLVLFLCSSSLVFVESIVCRSFYRNNINTGHSPTLLIMNNNNELKMLFNKPVS